MHDGSPDGAVFIARYARAWTVLIIIAGVILSLGLIAVGYLASLPHKYLDAFTAIGESVLASLLLYILISVFLDPRRQIAQAHSLAGYAIEEANRQFQQRFAASLPTAVYEASSLPKIEFRENFVELLTKSTRYDHCGTTAHFASFRLASARNHSEVRHLDQIRLCVLDPRADEVIRAHCLLRMRDDPRPNRHHHLVTEVARMKEEVFTTLLALFDISGYVSTAVYLHTNLPYFRCEMLDDGMFLTYYLGDARYPETLEFEAATRPYRAYKSAMILVRRFATKTIQFGSSGPSADLVHDEDGLRDLLAELGCTVSIQELRQKRDARFANLAEGLTESGMGRPELF
jgi:hypothetical protein